MKKTILILAIVSSTVLLTTNCGNSKKETVANTTTEEPTKNITKEPDYVKGEALVNGSDCATCHKPDIMLTGPSYAQIADKYSGNLKTIDSLANTIIKGSKGKWGTQVMTAHPALTPEDAASMVKYIFYFKSNS